MCANDDCKMPSNRVGTSVLSKKELQTVLKKVESRELEEDIQSILVVKEKSMPGTPEKKNSHCIEIDLDELADTVCELCG